MPWNQNKYVKSKILYSNIVNAIMKSKKLKLTQRRNTEDRSPTQANDEDVAAIVMHYLLTLYSLKQSLRVDGT